MCTNTSIIQVYLTERDFCLQFLQNMFNLTRFIFKDKLELMQEICVPTWRSTPLLLISPMQPL